jgi:hypothetical protein
MPPDSALAMVTTSVPDSAAVFLAVLSMVDDKSLKNPI